jgi:hypothetical protein
MSPAIFSNGLLFLDLFINDDACFVSLDGLSDGFATCSYDDLNNNNHNLSASPDAAISMISFSNPSSYFCAILLYNLTSLASLLYILQLSELLHLYYYYYYCHCLPTFYPNNLMLPANRT